MRRWFTPRISSAACTSSTEGRPLLVAPLAAVALAGAALVGAGCGDVGGPSPPPPDLGPPMVELVNQGTGDDRPLEKAMLHSAVDNYSSADNWLEEPLRVGQRVRMEGFRPGSYYLTVVRKMRSLDVSERVALTTARPVDLRSGRYEIWAFDESFRIFLPTNNRRRADGGIDTIAVDSGRATDAVASDATASDATAGDAVTGDLVTDDASADDASADGGPGESDAASDAVSDVVSDA